MRKLIFAAFCTLGLAALSAPAAAQGVTRLCTPIYNANTGAMSCPEVGQTGPGNGTNPLPVTSSGGSSTANQGAPNAGGASAWPVASQPSASTTSMSAAAPTAATFSSILASNASRIGCTVQNNSATLGYVYFGATGSASTSNSFQVPAGATINCATQTGAVLTDNVAATCASGTCAFIVGAQ